MGIDIYMKWPKQTKKEHEAQFTGFSVIDGDKGYLREAYHGEPYATKFLVREAFANKSGEARIKASVLRARLPETLKLAIQRGKDVYNEKLVETSPECQAFTDFVILAERMEKKLKKPVTIWASY